MREVPLYGTFAQGENENDEFVETRMTHSGLRVQGSGFGDIVLGLDFMTLSLACIHIRLMRRIQRLR